MTFSTPLLNIQMTIPLTCPLNIHLISIRLDIPFKNLLNILLTIHLDIPSNIPINEPGLSIQPFNQSLKKKPRHSQARLRRYLRRTDAGNDRLHQSSEYHLQSNPSSSALDGSRGQKHVVLHGDSKWFYMVLSQPIWTSKWKAGNQLDFKVRN